MKSYETWKFIYIVFKINTSKVVIKVIIMFRFLSIKHVLPSRYISWMYVQISKILIKTTVKHDIQFMTTIVKISWKKYIHVLLLRQSCHFPIYSLCSLSRFSKGIKFIHFSWYESTMWTDKRSWRNWGLILKRNKFPFHLRKCRFETLFQCNSCNKKLESDIFVFYVNHYRLKGSMKKHLILTVSFSFLSFAPFNRKKADTMHTYLTPYIPKCACSINVPYD